MTDIDERLRETAMRWRAAQPAAGYPNVGHQRARAARSWNRPSLRLAAAGLMLPMAALIAFLVADHSNHNQVVHTGTQPNGAVPFARRPLLTKMPATTPAVQITAGTADSVSWSLWAKVSPLDASPATPGSRAIGGLTPTFNGGLDLEVVTPQATGGGGDDPTRMDSLVWRTYGPQPGFPDELVYGVTSIPASQVQISFTGTTTTITTAVHTDRHFPHLRFYAAVAPANVVGVGIAAEAIASDGTPLVMTSPQPPIPPATIEGSPTPGNPPMWPLPGASPASRGSAIKVAGDFARQVLGLTGETVTAQSASDRPTVVTINLPASHTNVQVVAEPTTQGTWELAGFVGAAGSYGISFASGHATVELHLPANTASADITELGAGHVYHQHLDADQINSGTATLATNNVQALTIVYRNQSGTAVGVGGGTY